VKEQNVYFCGPCFITELQMKKYLSLLLLLLCLSIANAQHPTTNHFVPGDYDTFKMSCDSASGTFTIITDITQGNSGCSLFISGKMTKDKNGHYPLKVYPWGEAIAPFNGILYFGGNRKYNEIVIKFDGESACDFIYQFKKGESLFLDRKFPYHKFTRVSSKRAICYTDSIVTSRKKGYLVQYDLASILRESKDFCYVEFINEESFFTDSKKPRFYAWVKKSDLTL
jgi:hypothetical protein